MMSILGAFILTSAISMASTPDSETQDALRALKKASYKEFKIDQYAKELERKYLPKIAKEYGGILAFTYKLTQEKRVSFEWRF